MSVLGRALIIIAIFCGLICLMGVVFMTQNIQQGIVAMKPTAGCMLEATALRDAMVSAANANGGKFPEADSWTSLVADGFLARRKELISLDPMLRDVKDIHWSKDAGPWGCTIEGKVQAFQFNADLAGKALKEIKVPEKTVLIFELPENTNRSRKYERRGDRSKPIVLGQMRDWIVIPVSGKMTDIVGTGQGSPASRD